MRILHLLLIYIYIYRDLQLQPRQISLTSCFPFKSMSPGNHLHCSWTPISSQVRRSPSDPPATVPRAGKDSPPQGCSVRPDAGRGHRHAQYVDQLGEGSTQTTAQTQKTHRRIARMVQWSEVQSFFGLRLEGLAEAMRLRFRCNPTFNVEGSTYDLIFNNEPNIDCQTN